MCDLRSIETDLRYRIDRIALYGEMPGKDALLSELRDWLSDLENYEEDHSECVSEDRLSEVEVERDDLAEQLEKLQAKFKRRRPVKADLFQTVKDERDRALAELSDARADLEVYRRRIERGMTHAILAENFAFTPEEARAQFRIV